MPKATQEKRPDLALRCSKLKINGRLSTIENSFHILFESIRIIESILEENPDEDLSDWVEMGHSVAQSILQTRRTDQTAKIMQVRSR